MGAWRAHGTPSSSPPASLMKHTVSSAQYGIHQSISIPILPIKGALADSPYIDESESPRLLSLSFTHILQIDFVKEPGKTIAIVEIDIISALAIPLSSDFP